MPHLENEANNTVKNTALAPLDKKYAAFGVEITQTRQMLQKLNVANAKLQKTLSKVILNF
jgi:hypothetical protein